MPYFPSDFHCKNDITNWNDAAELNGGWLSGLADLNTEKEYVQERIVYYFIDLLSIGFSGLSLPSAKHIYPSTFATIFKKLKESLGGQFPEDFIAILQLTFGWEKQVLICEKTKLSNFGEYFNEILKENYFTDKEIEKIKIWNSGFPQEYPECDGAWKISPERHAISIEWPDDINLNSYYNIYIRDKDIETHRSRTMDMFNNIEKNWKIKSVFSMFSLINGSTGFPDGKSDCSKCQTEVCKIYCTKSFPYQKAYNPLSIGYDAGNITTWKEGIYTRVHRDLRIINSMREWMNLDIMTEEELYYNERKKANCSEECLICDTESMMKNMCLICNISNGFYPLIYPGYDQKYYECLNRSMKYERIYFNETEEAFKPCYETCRECDMEGNSENHNCKECEFNLIERTNLNSLVKNCVTNCTYSYYITPYGQYKCNDEIPKNPIEASKFIKDKNKCIDDSKNDNKYKYLYNGICLVQCPNNTFEHNFECLHNKILEFFNEKSSIIKKDKDYDINYIINEIKNDKTDITLKVIKEENKDLLIKKGDIIYQISSINNIKKNIYNNLSDINLEKCEKILKDKYNIKQNETIIFLKLEYNLPMIHMPIIEYQLFHPLTKDILDLNYCKNTYIDIYIPANINEDISFKYDPNSEYYSNLCYPYTTEFGTDITLYDRKNEFINKNFSLCEKDCTYNGYNINTSKALCQCKIKTKFSTFSEYINKSKNELLNNFVDIKKISNVFILKCGNFLFKKSSLIKNIGNYIILLVIFIHIIGLIIYSIKGFKILLKDIKEILNDKKEKKDNIIETNNNNSSIKNELIINKNKNQKFMKMNMNLSSNAFLKNNGNIKINIKENNISKIKILKFTDIELNSLNYLEAINNDKRTYFQIYFSLLRKKHLLIFAFYPIKDYNIMIIKICLFFFFFSLYYFVNVLFFTDDAIHKIYESQGIYDFVWQIPQIIYSTLISEIIISIIKYLSLSEHNVIKIKLINEYDKCETEVKKLLKRLKIKFTLYFVLSFVFLLFFWYYLSIFCAIYKNTQLFLIKDTIISFGTTLIYPLITNLLPLVLRMLSLKHKNKDKELLYNVSKILQYLL